MTESDTAGSCLKDLLDFDKRWEGVTFLNAPPEYWEEMRQIAKEAEKWNKAHPLIAPPNPEAGEQVRQPSYYETLIKRRLKKEGVHE